MRLEVLTTVHIHCRIFCVPYHAEAEKINRDTCCLFLLGCSDVVLTLKKHQLISPTTCTTMTQWHKGTLPSGIKWHHFDTAQYSEVSTVIILICSCGEMRCDFSQNETQRVIVWCPSLHTCCYFHCYLGRCWSKPNCCLDRATLGGHPLTGPPASLFRLPKLALSVICTPVATAAAVALVQCGNVARDTASKGKQRGNKSKIQVQLKNMWQRRTR
jgi:hypothetical protein